MPKNVKKNMNQFFFEKIEKLFAKIILKFRNLLFIVIFQNYLNSSHVPYRHNRIGQRNIELVPFSRYLIFSVILVLKRTDVLKYEHNFKYLENQLTDRKNGTSSKLFFSMRLCRYAT